VEQAENHPPGPRQRTVRRSARLARGPTRPDAETALAPPTSQPGRGYFGELLGSLQQTPASVQSLLQLSRGQVELFESIQHRLLKELRSNVRLRDRVMLLQSIPGVGEVLALTWVLEIGEVQRFGSIARAVSYCGLCSAQRSSAGREQRGPISKQRHKYLQTMLIEAAKLAPRYNPPLAAVHEQQLARGNRNRATLAVARKLVAYLMAVDKSGKAFQPRVIEGGASSVNDQKPALNSPAGCGFYPPARRRLTGGATKVLTGKMG
jgi:transposase